jgi:DNA polymerase-3 subunit beta
MDGSFPSTSTITLEAAPTRKALHLIKPACPRRYVLPPRLDITNHHSRTALTGRELDLEITVALDAPYTPFTGNLPFHELAALLRPCTGKESVTITRAGEQQVKIDLPDIAATISTMEPEYPAPIKKRSPPNGATARIAALPLTKALELVTGSQSTEETRYYLNGTYIHPHPTDETALNFVSTDGHRLVSHTVTGIRHNFQGGFIMPRAAVGALRQLLAAYPEATLQFVMHGDTAINITSPEFELATKLIDGAFPDYTRLIPKDVLLAITLDSASLRRFLMRAGAVNSGMVQGIKLAARKGDSAVHVSWASGDIGTLTAQIAGRCERDIEIGFQNRYLSHALSILKTPQIQLHASDGMSPAILTGAAELADPLTTIVLMPMRI